MNRIPQDVVEELIGRSDEFEVGSWILSPGIEDLTCEELFASSLPSPLPVVTLTLVQLIIMLSSTVLCGCRLCGNPINGVSDDFLFATLFGDELKEEEEKKVFRYVTGVGWWIRVVLLNIPGFLCLILLCCRLVVGVIAAASSCEDAHPLVKWRNLVAIGFGSGILSQVLAIDVLLIPIAACLTPATFIDANDQESSDDDDAVDAITERSFIIACFPSTLAIFPTLFFAAVIIPLLIASVATLWILNAVALGTLCCFAIPILSWAYWQSKQEEGRDIACCRASFEWLPCVLKGEVQWGELRKDFVMGVASIATLTASFILSVYWILSILYGIIFINWVVFHTSWLDSQTTPLQIPAFSFAFRLPMFAIPDHFLILLARLVSTFDKIFFSLFSSNPSTSSSPSQNRVDCCLRCCNKATNKVAKERRTVDKEPVQGVVV